MITDLTHVITSYLDPSSYKILNSYKPKKYNKLNQNIKNYELVIPEFTKYEIIKSGIVLKTEIVELYNQALYTISPEYYYRKVYDIIYTWLEQKIQNLFLRYEKIDYDIEYISDQLFSEKITVCIKNKNTKTNHIITYPENVIYSYENYSILNMYNKLIQKSKQPDQEFSDYLNTSFMQDQKIDDKMIFQFCKQIDDLKFLFPTDNSTYQNSIKYYSQNLFQFTDFDSSLMRVSIPINFPETFLTSLYYILQTADLFHRMAKSYMQITE